MNIVKRVEAFCVPAVVLLVVWLALNVGVWLPEIIGALRRLHGWCF